MRYLKARLASASAAARRLRDGAPDPLDTVENEAADITDADQDFVEEGSLVGAGRQRRRGPRHAEAEGHDGRDGSRHAGGTGTVVSPIPPPPPMPPAPPADSSTAARAPVRSPMPSRARDRCDPFGPTRPISRGPEGSVRSVEPDGSPEAARTEAAAEPTSRWRSYRGGFSWGPGPKAADAAAAAAGRRGRAGAEAEAGPDDGEGRPMAPRPAAGTPGQPAAS